MKYNLTLLAFYLLACSTLYAQTGIYKSYDDFINGRLEKMAEDVRYSESSFGVVVKFKSVDGESVNYKPKNMWGFLFKGNLFRTDENDITYVSDTGKVCFYENGTARMNMIRTNSQYGHFIRGVYSYMSAGLNDKIHAMPFSDGKNFIIGNRKQYKGFMKQHPEYDKLYECIDRSVSYLKIRQCVAQFNATN